MSVRSCLKLSVARIVFSLVPLLATVSVAAQEEEGTREATKHFQTGVTLYGDADYHAALVEFQRAYTLAPNVAVLYNVAEAQYQLQDYARALTTFERYIAMTPASDSRRSEVEQTLAVLRSRVGHLSVVTDPPSAEVSIDDLPIGKTPFEQPVTVSIGPRKVTAALFGHQTVTKRVDITAEDSLTLTIQLPAIVPDGAQPPRASTQQTSAVHSASSAEASRHTAAVLRTLGWATTGVFAAGAVSFGILALKSSSDLAQARATYPTTRDTLDRDANATKLYSVLADSLTAAAVVVGGITLVSSLSTSSSRKEPTSARFWLGPTSANFDLTF
jgi:tetratricopeptide (TPR) repeat protein